MSLAAPAAGAGPLARAEDPYRVMVVDDSATIRGLLTRALEPQQPDSYGHQSSVISHPDPSQPLRRVGVAGHPPVAAGGQGDRANLRTVGRAIALPLIAKETLVEDSQPLPQDLVGKLGRVGARVTEELAPCQSKS